MVKHLKGLDTLRAIAALIVVWSHIEQLKRNRGLPNLIESNFNFLPDGHLGVVLFFVLSGFLITFLLIKEREKDGKISFKKFYLRRILRIWPLYYAVLLLSFLLIEAEYTVTTVLLCLSIFPNIAAALFAGWPTSPQVWSIGVEEQFYLFWPLLLTLIPEKRVLIALLLFFVGYSLLYPAIFSISARTDPNFEFGPIITEFFHTTKFNCMAIGALVGFMYAKKHAWLKFISNQFVAYPSVILSGLLWLYGLKFTYFTDEFFSILFAIAIYNIVTHPRINIDTKVSSFLGQISYGIYMYHFIVLLLALKYIPVSDNILLYNFYLYVAVIFGTILISWVSFNTVEKYFLNIKRRYETK